MNYGINLGHAQTCIATLDAFSTGTLSGQFEDSVFTVRSYGVAIATRNQNGVIWVNGNKYSQTTSRHTNLVRKAWGLN
jgi:hypothetical protein